MRKPITTIVLFFVILLPASADSAIDHFKRGNRYLEGGEAAKALSEYEDAIRLNPFYKEAYYSLGLIYNASGLIARATSVLEKAIEIDPHYVEAMVALGEVYDRSANHSRALEIYNRSLEIEPNNKGARLGLAAVYRKNRLWQQALSEYERVIGIDPGEDLALLGLGDLSRDQGFLDEAIDYYTQALVMNPSRLQTYLKRGEAYERSGFKERALENYQNALELAPNDMRPYRSLGRFYVRRGDLDNAIDAYRVLTRLSPLDGLSHYALGVVRDERGRLKEAIADYSEAVRLNRDDEIARYRLEESLIKNDAGGNPSPRRREMALYHLVQGDRYYDRLELKKALYEYERALHLGRQDVAVRRRLILVYERMGYRESAIAELDILLELEPGDVDARDRLERLIHERGSADVVENVDLSRVPESTTRLAVFDLKGSEDDLEAHIDLGAVVSELIKLFLGGSGRVQIISDDELSEGMRSLELAELEDVTQARLLAELLEVDAFLFGEVSEGLEDLRLSARLVWVDSVQNIAQISLTEFGNNRLVDASAATSAIVLENLPFRGLIIGLDRDQAVINLGRMEDISEGMEFVIYRRRLLRSDPSDGRVALAEEEVGRLMVVGVDEQVAVGRITTVEALGRVNLGDVVRILDSSLEDENGS